MRRSKGYKTCTRKLLRKPTRRRGMIPLGRLLREYTIGQKVDVIIDPSVAKGQPHRRFHGKVGTILEKRGRAYVVGLKDGEKPKQLIVRPEHLVPHK